MKPHKPHLFLLAFLLVSVLGVGLYFQYRTPATNSPSVSSKSVITRTPAEDTELVKASLTAITASLKTNDIQKFQQYVDTNSLCDSVFETLYAKLKVYLGDLVKKSDIVDKCKNEITQYVENPTKQNSSGNASIVQSLDQIFSPDSKTEITRKDTKLEAKLVYQGQPIAFVFQDTGTVAQWASFTTDIQLTPNK